MRVSELNGMLILAFIMPRSWWRARVLRVSTRPFLTTVLVRIIASTSDTIEKAKMVQYESTVSTRMLLVVCGWTVLSFSTKLLDSTEYSYELRPYEEHYKARSPKTTLARVRNAMVGTQFWVTSEPTIWTNVRSQPFQAFIHGPTTASKIPRRHFKTIVCPRLLGAVNSRAES